ncbi:MAG TPA: sigma-70 family RNA polymerase sigma factor [bacterium]|nr:sigma-70 family RNA polymerase sigma factor [bacterium]
MSDAELVKGILSGTVDFEVLWERFWERVGSWLRIWVSDGEDRRDVQICVLTLAWQRLDQYDPSKGSLCTWLYRMARSVAFSFLRKKRLKMRSLEELVGVREPACEGPAEEHDLGELKRALWRAVGELPEPEQAALELYYHEGYAWAEVAGLRGTSIRTAKFHGARGLVLLRNKLACDRCRLGVL